MTQKDSSSTSPDSSSEAPDTVTVPMVTKTEAPKQITRATSLLVRIAERYGIDKERMLETLKATAFKSTKEVSNEQMVALLVVAEQHKLNPFLRELYAFPDERAGIVPVVSVDGWTRIMQEHPQFDGYDVRWADELVEWEGKAVPAWCEITMYRKDRNHHITHREWFDEVRRGSAPWKSHPRRMLEHKTVIQTARRTFGFAGIYDEDEAQRIVESSSPQVPQAIANINKQLGEQKQAA